MTELADWTFDIHECSAGVYRGTATHVSGASMAATDDDPDALLRRLRAEVANFAIQ